MNSVNYKYSIGQSLWTIKDHKAYQFEVAKVTCRIAKDGSVDTDYYESETSYSSFYGEEYCYASKEELIASL